MRFKERGENTALKVLQAEGDYPPRKPLFSAVVIKSMMCIFFFVLIKSSAPLSKLHGEECDSLRANV